MGIFQSIGFKEFHDYLMLTKEQQESAQGRKLFDQGLSLMKLATIQYAKRQVKWIKRRFLARGKDQVPPVFKLNVTDINKWNEEVRDKTYSVVEAMLNGEPIPVEPEEPLPPSDVVFKLVKCEQCDRLFESPQQLQHHLGSQKHKRRLAKLKRQEEEQNSTKTTEKTAIKT